MPSERHASFTRTVNVTVFRTVYKWVQYNSMVLFTHNVKNIKDAAYKNGDVDGTCKRALKNWVHTEISLG